MKVTSNMKRILNSLFIIISLGFITKAHGQVDFQLEINTVDSLVQTGEFEGALTKITGLRSSIEETELANQDSVKLFFYSKLAFIHYNLYDCENTIINSQLDAQLRNNIYGEADLLTLSSMRTLGVYYLNCDALAKADSTLNQVITLHRKHIGPADELYIRTLDDLAYVNGTLGNTEKAIGYYEDLLDLLKNSAKGDFYIQVIENYSALLMNTEKYSEAAAFYEDLKTPMQEKPEYLSFLKDYYNVFVHQKDYVKALEAASLLIEEGEQNPDKCTEYKIYLPEFKLNCARLAMTLAKYQDAETFYATALDEYNDRPELQIQILLERAQLSGIQKDLLSQINDLEKSKRLHESNGLTESGTYTTTTLQLGRIYTEMGLFDLADQLFKEYTTTLENNSNSDPLVLAQAYQSLGNQRYLMQNFKDADLFLLKAQDLLIDKQLNQTKEYASILNSLGALNEAIANYDLAEKKYRNALKISNKVDIGVGLRIALASNLANILTTYNPSNDSIGVLYNNAIDWQTEYTGVNHPDYANLLGNRGLYYQNQKNYKEAENDYQQSLSILEYTVGNTHPEFITNTSNLGLLYDEQGNHEKALEFMLEAKRLYEVHYSEDHPGYVLTLNNLANLYTKTDVFGQAESLLMKLADIQVKEIRESFTYLSEDEKKNFVKEKRKFLDNLKQYIITRHTKDVGSVKPEVLTKWYELELSMKGILLNATMKIRNKIFESGDKELASIFSEWTLVRKQIADLQSLKNEHQTNAKAALDSLSDRIVHLEKELSRKSSEFSSSFTSENFNYTSISNALSANECSIEVIRIDMNTESVYTALLVKPSTQYPELIILGKGADLEKKAFKLYKNAIAYKIEDPKSFGAFWQPIHDQIANQGIEKIYFSADGVYHKLSLSTLFNTQTKSYLLDDFDVVQLTSTKEILTLKARSGQSQIANQKILLVGRPTYDMAKLQGTANATSTSRAFGMGSINDLPGTEEEVNGICGVLTKSGIEYIKLLGEESNENNLKSNLNNDVVHIATHGFFIDKSKSNSGIYLDPMLYSGLLLAGVSNDNTKALTGEDGILTAYEIMNLEFSGNDMIVLSACETGSGEVATGEGIYGLQRAFFVAGTKSLVMSLWKVDDQATKDLMINFYKGYLKNGNKREAFISAQKKVKKKYKSPIYWGAFVMVGG